MNANLNHKHQTKLAQGHTDGNSSAAKKQKVITTNTEDTTCEDQTKLAEHYRDLCIRLTEQLGKTRTKADRRTKRLQALEKENKELRDEIAALKLKSTECEMKNTNE